MLKYILLALLVSAAISTESDFEDSDYKPEFEEAEAPEDLKAVVKHLQGVAHRDMQFHVNEIAKHAELLQDTKAKAYAHNFRSSKAAIMAALRSLSGQLSTGHKHDVKILKQEKARGNKVIGQAKSKGTNKCRSFREKACPTKRLMNEALAKKKKTKRAKDDIENANVCNVRTSLGDMAIDKARPKLGAVLRNKWNQVRAKWLKAKAKYVSASRAYSNALNKYNRAMSAFTTSVRIEATNANSACRNAHKEYNLLKRDVGSNVNMRKQVFISTLVVTCYVDNLTSNASARSCANKKRRASTSQWNINGGSLGACASVASLKNSFGPPNWKPTSRNCALKHWNEGAHKEKLKKEKAKKAERVAKEKAKKKAAELKSKELSKKEKAKKAQERKDKAAKREKKAKADERRSKELQAKERSAKERNNKAKARERSSKKSFTCTVTTRHSNNAGVIRAPTHGGYVSTGGGMNNHYRSFNHLSAFEEMMPEGNHYRCDTGFGPGRLTCYNIQCKAGGGGLSCGIWSVRFTGSGQRTARTPGGYTMTGGGIYNHYRSFNARAGFEDSFPDGNNGWKGDMGFGWGDYTVYVRGCRPPSGTRFDCRNVNSGHVRNHAQVNCPGGFKLTGCGIQNHYRSWNHLAAFEETRPHGQSCICDSGFGGGRQLCFARCCRLV